MLISIGDIIKNSWELYKKNFKPLFSYVLWLVLSGAAVAVAVGIMIWFLPLGILSGIASGLLAFAFIVFAALISIAMTRTIAELYNTGKSTANGTMLSTSIKYIIPTFLASLLAGLAIFGGMILLIIPGIIFAIWFAFPMYAIIFDNKKIVESLSFSKSLVSGRWWAVAGRMIVPGIVFAFIALGLQLIIAIPFEFALESMSEASAAFLATTVAEEIIVSIAAYLVLPLSTAAPTLLYLELVKNPVATPSSEKK